MYTKHPPTARYKLSVSSAELSAPETTVIIGASVAGVRAAAALRLRDSARRIVLVESEAEVPCDKPPLSKGFLTEPSGATITTGSIAADLEYRLDTTVIGIDPTRSMVNLNDGTHLEYDTAVIATGSAPRRLPALESIPRVHYLRNAVDAAALRRALSTCRHLGVVGGGFIGAEVASSARELGVDVTIIEAQPHLAARVLPRSVADAMSALHADRGVELRYNTIATAATYDARAQMISLLLSNGQAIECDVVLVGIGTRPATAWAESALTSDDGFLCDSHLRVAGTENVYAAGDVARWTNPRYGRRTRVEHWTCAREHAVTVAHNITHPTQLRRADPVPYVWSDQHGTHIQHVGDPDLTGADVVDVPIPERSVEQRLFAYIRDGISVGATGFNAQAHIARVRRSLLTQGRPDFTTQSR